MLFLIQYYLLVRQKLLFYDDVDDDDDDDTVIHLFYSSCFLWLYGKQGGNRSKAYIRYGTFCKESAV